MTNNSTPQTIDKPWSLTGEAVLDQLDVARENGLTGEAVDRRLEEYGANLLRETRRRSAWNILIEQFKSLVVGLLVVAALVSFGFGEFIEGIAILAVILINAAIGFFTELRAVRSMEALKEIGQVTVKVRRDGRVKELPAEDIVPGDMVVVEGGDVVSADLRLLEAAKLQANESALTGESVPVTKQVEPLEEETPLAERKNMLFKGTGVTRGSGEGVVVATGMNTELGQISSLVEEAEEEVTPLEKRLDSLGRNLVWVTLAIAVVIAVTGIIVGKDPFLIIETAIALAVATVPEGLPIVATIALARGMRRMAQRNALINRLSAVETLGATTIICTDKTGTLTENRMTVSEIALARGEIDLGGEGLEIDGSFSKNGSQIDPGEDEVLRRFLEVGVLCNNASLQLEEEEARDRAIGEPLEVALLVAGGKAGIWRGDLLEKMPEAREVAFDPDVKMMATFHQTNGGYRIAVKGAAEAVLSASQRILTPDGERRLSEDDRNYWEQENERMADEGLRVLALATRTSERESDDPYKDLTFLGLAGLMDPPREEVRPALIACKNAGVQVIMVTGDHPVTARNIGKAVGLVENGQIEVVRGQELKAREELSAEEREHILQASILARVSPKQKLDLIRLHQESGAIVAMTGDGVNDAPALKKADIGVAMGQRGTEVAREAADMVLRDDAFSSIVVAVEQGRVIFENIRKFVFYLLSCNVSEIMVISLASLVNAPLPIRPLQILYLNLVTDVFPALALGVGEGDRAIMERPPRDPDESILTRSHWIGIGGYGALITISVLSVFAFALTNLGRSQAEAVTISFLTLAAAQLWHVFNMRDQDSGIWRNEITANPYVWGALVLTLGLLFAAVYLPGLSDVLQTVDPGLDGWLIVFAASLFPLIVGQLWKVIKPNIAKATR